MTGTTANASPILIPSEVGQLFLDPLIAISVAAQIATVVPTGSHSFRIPMITADPTAQWVNEGEEISTSDATHAEIEVVPSKLAGLSIITRELANDSSPEAADVIGLGLARDCARKMDAAFFGNLAKPAPAGLGSLTGARAATTVSAGTAWKNADPFTAAVYAAANRNAVLESWVAHPDDAQALATLKESTSSQRPLLQPDPTQAGRTVLNGLPMLTSTAVTSGTVWGVPRSRAIIVVREDVEVEADRSVFFTSDRVAIRATARIGFAFPDPSSIVKIVKGS